MGPLGSSAVKRVPLVRIDVAADASLVADAVRVIPCYVVNVVCQLSDSRTYPELRGDLRRQCRAVRCDDDCETNVGILDGLYPQGLT